MRSLLDLADGVARLFRQECMGGIGLAQGRDNHLLCGPVDFGDEIVALLDRDLDGLDVEAGSSDDAPGGARGAHRDVQHGMHGASPEVNPAL